MKELPILFSGAMVNAILDDLKTKTRRVIKPQPLKDESFEVGYYNPRRVGRDGNEYPGEKQFGIYGDDWDVKCPYGAPGDRLWVREAWRLEYNGGVTHGGCGRYLYAVSYKAGGEDKDLLYNGPCALDSHIKIYDSHGDGYRPSIHMPRAYSRIDLEITGVRVERLQKISEDDAISEGTTYFISSGKMKRDEMSMRSAFADLWDSINAKRGYGWDANPYVWVIEFKRIRP